MAHKKGLGSSRNGRDSNPKMLGVKIFSGQEVKAGMILVRQRGTKFHPGSGTGIGRDDTIFATRPGTVAFRQSGERRFIEVGDSDSAPRRPNRHVAPSRTGSRRSGGRSGICPDPRGRRDASGS